MKQFLKGTFYLERNRKFFFSTFNYSFYENSLSRGRREREMLRIAKENMNMLKRIHNKKPAISTDKLDKDWKQTLKFMDNISAFPEDWYKKEKSMSNPSFYKKKPLDKIKSADGERKPAESNDYDDEFEQEK